MPVCPCAESDTPRCCVCAGRQPVPTTYPRVTPLCVHGYTPYPYPYVPARPYPHNPGATAQTRMYSTQSGRAEQRGTNEAKQAKPDEDGKPNTTRGTENQNQTEGDK